MALQISLVWFFILIKKIAGKKENNCRENEKTLIIIVIERLILK